MTDELNADFSQRAEMQTATMAWQPSPSPTVWRKRLDLSGSAEQGRVTSLVRYDPHSQFASHDHPLGEEIFVLNGTFSDEHGHYPTGSYILNPQGFRHAPFSDQGCLLFVKLCQYAGEARQHIRRDTTQMPWLPGTAAGIELKLLYDGCAAGDGTSEQVRLIRLVPGVKVPDHDHPLGEEIFVIEGSLEDREGVYPAGAWVRYPAGSRHSPSSKTGCILYVKSGHLPA